MAAKSKHSAWKPNCIGLPCKLGHISSTINFTVGTTPAAIAFDGENMWVTNYDADTVSVLRASDGYHVMTPTVGVGPGRIAFDGTNMWVTNYIPDTVSVIRASDGYHVRATAGRGDGQQWSRAMQRLLVRSSGRVPHLRADGHAELATVLRQ